MQNLHWFKESTYQNLSASSTPLLYCAKLCRLPNIASVQSSYKSKSFQLLSVTLHYHAKPCTTLYRFMQPAPPKAIILTCFGFVLPGWRVFCPGVVSVCADYVPLCRGFAWPIPSSRTTTNCYPMAISNFGSELWRKCQTGFVIAFLNSAQRSNHTGESR